MNCIHLRICFTEATRLGIRLVLFLPNELIQPESRQSLVITPYSIPWSLQSAHTIVQHPWGEREGPKKCNAMLMPLSTVPRTCHLSEQCLGFHPDGSRFSGDVAPILDGLRSLWGGGPFWRRWKHSVARGPRPRPYKGRIVDR